MKLDRGNVTITLNTDKVLKLTNDEYVELQLHFTQSTSTLPYFPLGVRSLDIRTNSGEEEY